MKISIDLGIDIDVYDEMSFFREDKLYCIVALFVRVYALHQKKSANEIPWFHTKIFWSVNNISSIASRVATAQAGQIATYQNG